MPLQLGMCECPLRDLVNMASPVACYTCAEQVTAPFSIPFPMLLLSPGLCWDLVLFHSLSHEGPSPRAFGEVDLRFVLSSLCWTALHIHFLFDSNLSVSGFWLAVHQDVSDPGSVTIVLMRTC